MAANPNHVYKPGKKAGILISLLRHLPETLMGLIVIGTLIYFAVSDKQSLKNKPAVTQTVTVRSSRSETKPTLAATAIPTQVVPEKTVETATENTPMAVQESVLDTGTQYQLINLAPEKGLEDYIAKAQKDFLSFNRNSGDILLYAYVHIEKAFYLIGFISFEEEFETFDPETRPIPDTTKEFWRGKQPVFPKGTSGFAQSTDSAWFAIDRL